MKPIRCFLSAGEPSGDAHGAALARALRTLHPGIELYGFGGRAMEAAGVELVHSMERLSGRGLVELAGVLPAHARLLRLARRRFTERRDNLVIPIDYPGFNLLLAGSARRAGIPVLYYIAPQLWAWGAWRARRLRRRVNRLAVILPFEESFFRTRGIATDFVGHPLLECPSLTRVAARRALGLPSTTPVLGVFPGSRPAEVARHWPAFRDAAHLLQQVLPDLRVVIAAVPDAGYDGSGDSIVSRGNPRLVFAAATAGICKSGTTSLEAALAETPHVVAYRMHAVTYAAARQVVRVPWVGLTNLVAERSVVPELLQWHATPARLARAVRPLLDPDSEPARRQREGFSEVRRALGQPGAAARVASLALETAA